MIGIICAMSIEAEKLIEKIENIKCTEQIANMKYVAGTYAGKEVVVGISGIGKVSAALGAQHMILKYHPDYIINTGVAGSLSESLAICEVCISTDVVQHDMDTTPIGDPKGLISGLNVIEINADKEIAEKLGKCCEELGIKYTYGRVASGDQFIADKKRKLEIIEDFKATCCEMEGAAIGQACYLNSVPFVILRSISDSFNDSEGMEYAQFSKIAADNSAKIIDTFLRA